MPNREALALMVERCEARYATLCADGCDEGVAADRTFDALESALTEDQHCFDKRDSLFETRLRKVAAEGKPNA